MLQKITQTHSHQWGTLPLRLSLGIIFMAHGAQKLFGMFGGPGLEGTAGMFQSMGMAPGMLWATMAGTGEFFGGLLVLLGLVTRFGALNIAIVMLVAMTQVHWGHFFLPEGIEFTMALLGSALALIILGGGAYSVDAAIQHALPITRTMNRQTRQAH